MPEPTLDLLLDQHLSRDELGNIARSLLLELARFLNALHSHGWAYGALRWDSILYSVEPEPHVAVRNLEGARRIGGRPAFTWTGDDSWADPGDPSQVPTLDHDRFLFALMAYRLLVVQDAESQLELNPRYDVAGQWSPFDRHALNLLLRRAAQLPVGRPAIDQWIPILDSRDHRESRRPHDAIQDQNKTTRGSGAT